MGLLVLLTAQLRISTGADTAPPSSAPPAPKINIIFLDDGAIGLPRGSELRRNDWKEWGDRLPTFLDRLSLVGKFDRAVGDDADPSKTLYAIEIAKTVKPEQVEGIIASELKQIADVTSRPSVILARSSAGKDQLRIVVQDSRDYPPAHAAKFLRLFAEIAPSVPNQRIAQSFGPFNPPPTIVFDPRTAAPASGLSGKQLSKARWGVLEETYLLPHYVLHSLATLSLTVGQFHTAFYDRTVPEPGTVAGLLAQIPIANISVGPDAGSFAGHFDPGLRTYTSINEFRRDWLNDSLPQGFNIAIPNVNDTFEWARAVRDAGCRIGDLNTNGYRAWEASVDSLKAHGFADIGHARFINPVSGINPLGRHEPFYDTYRDANLYNSKATYILPEISTANPNRYLNDYLESVAPTVMKFNIPHDQFNWSIPVFGGLGGDIRLHDRVRPTIPEVPATLYLNGAQYGLGNFNNIYSAENYANRIGSSIMAGGILFTKGNAYSLDLSGRVRLVGEKAVAAVEKSGGIGGVFEDEGKRKLAGAIPSMGGGKKRTKTGVPLDLLAFQGDVAGEKSGSLPFAAPRFEATDLAEAPAAGGWTFEPLVAEGLKSLDRKTSAKTEVAMVPLETGNRLSYVARTIDSKRQKTTKGRALPPVFFQSEKGGFQPALLSNDDGTFSWKMSHGVEIVFNKDGLVQETRGPSGESVKYVRSGNQLVEKRASDNRSLPVAPSQPRPAKDKVPDNVSAKYASGKSILRIVEPGRDAVEWHLRPDGGIAGVTRKDSGILWTRSSDGRIIQLATGAIKPTKDGYEFQPAVVIGTLSQ
jgi:hypothetical protein